MYLFKNRKTYKDNRREVILWEVPETRKTIHANSNNF